jgi:hypothetical protein
MTMNGMLTNSAGVSELSTGRYLWMTSVRMPMPIATPTAAGRLRSRPATTAANAEAMSAVIPSGVSPLAGAASTPASPASAVMTIQTQIEILVGLKPDSEVSASEPTIARTLRPASVNCRTSVPRMTTPHTQANAINWSRFAAAPKIW